MVMNKTIKLSLIFLVGLIIVFIMLNSQSPVEDIPPATLQVTKKLVGDIWHVRCDYMDSADGVVWKRDVIRNPNGVLSKEGHSANGCGDAEHWVIWVGADGVPYRLDEINPDQSERTIPTLVYRPRYEFSTADIMALSQDDTAAVWRYSQNFVDPMPWSDIQIGQRIYWTTQIGDQILYHTGIPYRSTPSFVLYINGNGYPLVAGGSVEINDLLPGIYNISEEESPDYYLGNVSSNGEITDRNEWQVSVVIHEGELVSVDWPNIVKTPPPEDPPSQPGLPEVSTNTPLVELKGQNVWDDANDADHIRPDSVRIMLYANGDLVKSIEVAPSDSDESNSLWSYFFGLFPKVDENGELIKYSIIEESIAGYDSNYDGTSVVNSHATNTPPPD